MSGLEHWHDYQLQRKARKSTRTSFSAFLARPDSFFAFPPLGAIVDSV